MPNEINAGTPHHEEDSFSAITEYLNRAKAACDAGDAVLGMYLYLAAFEESATSNETPNEAALSGLKQAWSLACTHGERSLAEYIFERMEPYLSSEEISTCAGELHELALDKLEEFGLSRDDLEDMAQAISSEMFGVDEPIIHVERIISGKLPAKSTREKSSGKDRSSNGSQQEVAGALPPAESSSNTDTFEEVEIALVKEEQLNYDNIAGYDQAVKVMRDLGIGMNDDADFKDLVSMLNRLHGLPSKPALDTILFRSPVREDANRFMMATLGELNLPTIHMRMEENYQGMPILCVSAHAVDLPKSNNLQNVFANGGVLVLEDLDMWTSPMTGVTEDNNAFLLMQLTRGAREAVGLIQSSVENPDVYVLATSSDSGRIDDFFMEMMGSVSLVEIDYPTPEERVQIWLDIAKEHPSIRHINRADLVRLSANMPRYDIYMAAREAIEEAYKSGLMQRKYQPVTRDNIFDKLAAYQPLESSEYLELEDAVIRDFQADLSHIDDILNDDR